jgi:exopolysaccharide production protein ExoQ
MSASLATLVCAVGVLGLFYLNRDKSAHTSKALWLPVVWLWINGSRPVSMWIGMQATNGDASQLLEGSPLDRTVFAALIMAGLLVLIMRGRQVVPVLRSSWPLLLYFTFCLLSVLWSDFPSVAFKRWTKGIGDLVMVLIVVTDAQPIAAIQRLITRVGFILMPASVLMIRYYGELGRTYDRWSGEPANCGVATDKNMLGVITFVLTLGACWLVLGLFRDKNQPNRARRLLARGILLAFGVSLLTLAHSATSGACFVLGAGLMLAAGASAIGRRPAAVHALVLAILILGSFTMFFGGQAEVVHAMGRQTNLTGRTEIWERVIPLAENPIVGAGYESFWLGQRLVKMWNAFPTLYLNEAHNGYIEAYLNLGYVGVGLIALILVHGYRSSVRAFRCDPTLGALFLSYVLTASIYSITEAGFKPMDSIWIFLLLAIVASVRLAKLGSSPPESSGEPTDQTPEFASNAAFGPAKIGLKS